MEVDKNLASGNVQMFGLGIFPNYFAEKCVYKSEKSEVNGKNKFGNQYAVVPMLDDAFF